MPACPSCGHGHPDGARFCPECGAPLTGAPVTPAPESRRTVTILFSDIVGSTRLGERLDPETLRSVMSRYFGAMSAAIEREGGTVEKFIGDAIMAVFGLPVLHEDDALRAVRAALGMRTALGTLDVTLARELGIRLETRTGIHTGSVVAGDASRRERLVTGDAVNVAARLEQAAGPGEILLGEETWRLVRDAARTDPAGTIEARGKSVPVPAMRLIGLHGPGDDAPRRIPLVGREPELAAARDLFDRVVEDARAVLLTLLGPPGIGKSRLLEALLGEVDGRALVLRGRCPPDASGITWWPIRQVVAAAAGIDEESPAPEAVERLRAVLAGETDASTVAAVLARAFGWEARAAEPEEVAWAVRRSLESLAGARPLVVAVEDLHWASTPVLALLDHLVGTARDRALLVLCTARPDLVETAPGWAEERAGRRTVRLGGLDADAVHRLIAEVGAGLDLDPALRERIAESASGNPLFLVEMIRAIAEDVGAAAGDIPVPPTIAALLAGRIDRLPQDERSVAQRAAVLGVAFDPAAVAALATEGEMDDISRPLLALMRRDLMEPDAGASTAPGPGTTGVTGVAGMPAGAVRFRHALIRDAAYGSILKSERAALHERAAAWLEAGRGDRRGPAPALVGAHLEAAWSYRTELHDPGPEVVLQGRRAASALATAGRAARDAGDPALALGFFERAALLPSPGPRSRGALLVDLGRLLSDLDRSEAARDRATEALALATEQDEPAIRACARLLLLDTRLADGSVGSDDPIVDREMDEAVRESEISGDPRTLAETWQTRSAQAYDQRRFSDCRQAMSVALEHARATGDERFVTRLESEALVYAFVGPTPASQVVAEGERLLALTLDQPAAHAEALRLTSVQAALTGDVARGLALVDESIASYEALGQQVAAAWVRMDRAKILGYAGDLQAAEREMRRALAAGDTLGHAGLRGLAACRLAELLVGEGRIDEAEAMVARAEPETVALMQVRNLMVRTLIAAARGEPGIRERVETVVAVLDEGHLMQQIDLLVEAAEVMATTGDPVAARSYAREARQRAVSKEAFVTVRRIDALLERIGGAADLV
jgi:class 3 adenylate cyclase/tetratricopeptide (TPR) repeat protein